MSHMTAPRRIHASEPFRFAGTMPGVCEHCGRSAYGWGTLGDWRNGVDTVPGTHCFGCDELIAACDCRRVALGDGPVFA
jgi:hypothetical protein